jgi:hypothetical protein
MTPTNEQIRDEFVYQVNYWLSYMGFGFLQVEGQLDEAHCLRLVLIDSRLKIVREVNVHDALQALTTNGSLMADMAMSFLQERENLLRLRDRSEQLEFLAKYL